MHFDSLRCSLLPPPWIWLQPCQDDCSVGFLVTALARPHSCSRLQLRYRFCLDLISLEPTCLDFSLHGFILVFLCLSPFTASFISILSAFSCLEHHTVGIYFSNPFKPPSPSTGAFLFPNLICFYLYEWLQGMGEEAELLILPW